MQDTVSSNNDVINSNNATKNESDFRKINNHEADYSTKQKFP